MCPLLNVARHLLAGGVAFGHQVNADKGRRLIHRDVIEGNIVHVTTATIATFDENCVLHTGYGAIGNRDIAHPTGDFRAKAEGREVDAAQGAVFDENIFRRPANAHGIHAPTGFDGDRVVPRTDVAIFDHNIGVGINVNTVAIGSLAANIKAFDNNIRAIIWMDAPNLGVGRAVVLQGKAVKNHILALHGLNRDGGARIAQRAQRRGGYKATRASDGDVVGVVGENHTPVNLGGRTFKPAGDKGVIGDIRRFDDKYIFVEVQGGVGVNFHAADEVVARRHNDLATARRRTGVEGLLEGVGVLGGVVTFGPVIAHIELYGGLD